MTDTNPDTKTVVSPSYNWPEILAIIFSTVAIVLSGYSLFEDRLQHRDERNTELLDAIYNDWETLGLQDDWRVQHLMEAPDSYYEIRDLARRITAGLNETEKAEVFLAERATANLIFINVEHVLKQWFLARRVKDVSRLEILSEEVEFYAEVYLRNPRLLWLWSADGGKWVTGADPSSIEWYREYVLENPDHPLDIEPDPEGILPGFDWLGGPES